MVVVKCSVPACEFQTEDVSEALAIALLANHGLAHQTPVPPTQSTVSMTRGPRLERPTVNVGISVEEWNIFQRRWDVFRTGSGIDDVSGPFQLFQCAGSELGDSLLKSNPSAANGTMEQLMSDMRALAVIPIATSVLRTELLQLRQDRDEQVRSFAARVRGKAETCAFKTMCICGQSADYTDHVIRDVIVNGLYDYDIRREVLGVKDILQTPINEVTGLVETKEMARNALPSTSVSAVSSFQRIKKSVPTTTTTISSIPSGADQAKEMKCPECRNAFKMFTEGPRGWNPKPHRTCITCYREHRRKTRRESLVQHPGHLSSVHAVELESVSQVATNCANTRNINNAPRHRYHANRSGVISHLNHQIFTKGEWRQAKLRKHPSVPLIMSIAQNGIGGNNTAVEVLAIADTGAQSNLWSLENFLACGFSRNDLHPVSLSLSAANKSPINIEGAFFAKISTKPCNGISTSCNSMVYVSSSVKSMYLSYDSLLDLGLLSRTFPSLEDNHVHSTIDSREVNDGSPTHCAESDDSCSCPIREVPPKRPNDLPFPCTPENNEDMKAWLLNRYASSTFNMCPHRALPCMKGPEVEIHVDPSATPKTCHTPSKIPLHWQKQVYEDLIRDEALGVIERVPYGEPVTWCHRMVITRKSNGTPRRTVDLSPLNKHCQRETFAMESPFHMARRIPKNTWKTVTDAWNGYHSVPLRKSDRHLTTFITPFGRWRYMRVPQGFLSSGDGYNRRFDAIISSLERKERCVDDTIHYDTELKQHWWRTIDFLTQIGQAGIVLHPEKFQFAQRTVDFAGFRVSDATIEPLPKYLDAIRDFPSPMSTTDIRSWFGLVNQVSNYAQLREAMSPFKPFLGARCKFVWSSELEKTFQASKAAIVESIREGVEIFDIQKRTCLRPDWSKQGIGYFLLQQHCSCTSGVPDCCPHGWRITLAGSRFLSSTEQRYAAIEGEALAVAWGLEQTRYFTQGCDNLIVITDHKPLVKIFGDRTLDEITNTRLFRLKQRTLSWRFDIQHMPGKSNQAADATSRHPSKSGSLNSATIVEPKIPDKKESALMAAIRSDAHDLGIITWKRLAQETAADTTLKNLLDAIERGTLDRDDPNLGNLRPICDYVSVQEGVLIYQDRVVVPISLRQRILQHLHAAHQGTSSMEHRARAILFWPGMSKEIQETREKCAECNRNAPSQAATPPLQSQPPSTPFEAIFADFFYYRGRHYLVVGDRLSGWVEVLSSSAGTNLGGSTGLVSHLRSLFNTFGVPEELSSDGGPEFTAHHTENFLKFWGVKHRISSVSFPQSNGRAEVAVKTAKRLLMSNTGPTGSLDHDRFLGAMLQLRNTPDPDCNVSPAQIIFGRPLRDSLAFANRLEKYTNPNISPLWRDAWSAKEEALRTRMTRTTERLGTHSRALRPLSIGERVFLQNQQGPNPTKWDRSGVVMEALGHDQYRVKVDGSGRLTLRNRRFLRRYTQATPYISPQQMPESYDRNNGHNPAPQPARDRPQAHSLEPQFPPSVGPGGIGPVSQPQQTGSEQPGKPPVTSGNNPVVDAPQTQPSVVRVEKYTAEPVPPQLTPPYQDSRTPRIRRPPTRYEPETGTWITV